MLTSCPECSLQISDKAASCPHCGYPFKNPFSKIAPRKNSRKRRRLPNGFGQISEIKGQNLRKPFRAMVSVGKSETGRPIVKPLKPDSYFETYNDAYAALLEYNKNPYDLSDSITVEELYEKWTADYFPKLSSDSSKRTITSAWAYCDTLRKMRACDVRARHVKGVIDDGYKIVNGEKVFPSAATKARIKSLWNVMLDYAVEYEISDKNYARTFDLNDDLVKEAEEAKKEHISFTEDEMNAIWKYKGDLWADLLLIQCYMGWRPQEIGLIERANINLDEGYITGGMKTPSGKHRIVPIHSKVLDLVLKYKEESDRLGCKYLFTDAGSKITYAKYQYRFNKLRDELRLNPEHRSHDGRKWFVTAAKKAGMDEYALKYIVGHKISDVTEAVYTQRETAWLKAEIEKIK